MGDAELTVDGHRIEPLSPQTWDAFADLAERHNGVWGCCWCTHFHCYPHPPELKEIGAREFKRRRIEDDRAMRRWCSTATSPSPGRSSARSTSSRTSNTARSGSSVGQRPDYRITCLFVDRRYRRRGMAEVAVRGALELIAGAGGGLVESYPHDLPPDKKISASFLYNATRTMYERLGFTYQRSKGQGNCVMTKLVAAG